MKVKCITIEGENAIIAADEFDWLCEQAKRVEKLERVATAARAVVEWDWSDNDSDSVEYIEQLRQSLIAV